MNIKLNSKKPLNPANAFMDMLGGDNNGDIVQLPVELLTPYPDQKTFHKYSENKFIEIVDSIRENGILFPIIVRPYEQDGQTHYQILAGHNRTEAAKVAGFDQVPCIIKVVDDKIANRIFVTTNLNQRDTLLPSEKAYAYKLLMESEGGECQVGTDDSRRQIFRYMRLTYLIQPFLEMVDNDELAFLAGVNISYLNEKSQWLLNDYVTSNEIKIKLTQSESIKDMSNNGVISYEQLDKIFKKQEREKKFVKLPLKNLKKYFDGLDDDEIIKKITQIVEDSFIS